MDTRLVGSHGWGWSVVVVTANLAMAGAACGSEELGGASDTSVGDTIRDTSPTDTSTDTFTGDSANTEIAPPAVGCVGTRPIACAVGAGPSGLGDAVLVCRGGQPALSTCWEYCREIEGRVRTRGCVEDSGGTSCQCTDEVDDNSNRCTSATTQEVCNPPFGCFDKDCDDACGGPGASIGCGLIAEPSGRDEGCLCACDEPGAGRCTREFAPYCNTTICPQMGICDESGVWRGINQAAWCALSGEVPHPLLLLCDEEAGMYACAEPSGCNQGTTVCVSGYQLATCTGGSYEVESCAAHCERRGFNATGPCSGGTCGCWNNPCPEPDTEWVCGGGQISRCLDSELVAFTCDEVCSDKGMVYRGSCTTNAQGERTCACVSRGEANCSTGHWSSGGASCRTYWNGSKCCNDCMVCTPEFGCENVNTCR